MKKLIYFDASNGVSGDMIVGALIHLGLPIDHLREELSKLDLDEYVLEVEEIERQGIFGMNFRVRSKLKKEAHHHHHEHEMRGFKEIQSLIGNSELDPWVKDKSIAIFRKLGEAEAKVHRTPIDKVHFHEVGALDSIVDIVGACVGFRYFGVQCFFSSPLNLGGGTVTFSHGTWPVPAPATAELVASFPVLVGTLQGELTTPTGAAVVTELVEQPTSPPVCSYYKWGFGAGDTEFAGIPNMLRLLLGNVEESQVDTTAPYVWQEEELYLLETNIDDMDGEIFGYFMERALKEGALDVYYIPLHMKKNRPGLLLSILCREVDREKMAELVFQETTTLGLRWSPCRRWSLEREVRVIDTEYGKVRVKVGRFKGAVMGFSPEYEDLKVVAEKATIPLKTLRQNVLKKIRDSNDG